MPSPTPQPSPTTATTSLHALVIELGDCTFHAHCACGKPLTPHQIRADQSLDLFQPAWEKHLMTEVPDVDH